MRKSRRLLALILALIMALGLVPATQAYANTANLPPVTVTVNGQLVHFADQQPIIENDRVLVPVRGVFELMGFTITWDDAQRIARLTRSDITVVIPAASTSFVVNNTIITPDVPQRLVNDRLLLPLRAVAEAVGGVPTWDGVNRRAMIVTAALPSPTPTPTPTPAPGATPVPLVTAAPRFEGSAGFAMGGNAYMLGHRHANSIWGGGWSHHNLNRQFATLTGSIGRLDGSGAGARTIRFIGDGHELASYTVSGYTFNPINVVLDVRNVTVLRIEIDAHGTDGVSVVLGAPMLHRTHPAGVPTPTPRPTATPTATPVPLLTAAPRTDGSAGFGWGTTAYIQGTRYTNALTGGGWSNHHLNRRFATLTGVIGRQDGSGSENRTIRFIGDGNVLSTFTVGGTGGAQNISVDVRNVTNLRIEIDAPGTHGAAIVLGNATLHHAATVATTPAPLLTAAPRTDGSAGFGWGTTAYIQGIRHTNALAGGGWSNHHLNRRFTTLTGVIGRQDGFGSESRVIRFIGDGNVLSTFTVGGTSAAQNISVNVANVTNLRIEIDSPGLNGVSIVLGNAMLHPTTVTATPTPTPTPIPGTQPFLTAAPRVDGTTNFGWGGTAYMQGVRYTNALWNSTGVNAWSTHNLNRNFTTLTAIIGRNDNVAGWETRTIRFIGDGQVIQTFQVSGNEAIRQISVNVANVTTLRVEIDAPGTSGVSIVMGNAVLTPATATATPTPIPGTQPFLTAAPRVDGTTGFGWGGSVHMGGVLNTNAIWNNTGVNAWSTHNLNSNFDTLTAIIGRQDAVGGWDQRNIRFIGDGNVIATFTVGSTQSISVNVRNVTTLRIEIDAHGTNGVSIVMANAFLTPTVTAATTPTPLVVGAPQVNGSHTGFGTGGTVYMLGIQYTNAIWGGGWSDHNLNSRFVTLTAVVGRQSNTSGTESRTIRFISGGQTIHSVTISGTSEPTNIALNVNGVNTLRIEIDAPGSNGVSIALGNIILHPTAAEAAAPSALVNLPRTGGNRGQTGQHAYMNGVRYDNAIWDGGYAVFRLGNRFTVFQATLGRVDNIAGDHTRYVRIYGRNIHGQEVLLRTESVSGASFARRAITPVDVTGMMYLVIRIDTPGTHGVTPALGNPRVR